MQSRPVRSSTPSPRNEVPVSSLPGRLSRVAVLALATSVPAAAQCLDWKPGFGSPIAGPNGEVDASLVFDDGGGPKLYVGGNFTVAGDEDTTDTARWNGAGWEKLDGASGGRVLALCAFEELGTP